MKWPYEKLREEGTIEPNARQILKSEGFYPFKRSRRGPTENSTYQP